MLYFCNVLAPGVRLSPRAGCRRARTASAVYYCKSKKMISLGLPQYDIKLRLRADGKREVYDFLRRRYVLLTPEEWVRQHFTHYLVDSLAYPAALLANEVSLTLNGVTRRCDSVLYHRQGGRPRVICEYKAPDVPITQRVFDQICSYNSVLRSDYLLVSNGTQHFALAIDYATRRATFLDHIPAYAELRDPV